MSAITITREYEAINRAAEPLGESVEYASAISVESLSKIYPVPFARLRRLARRCLSPVTALRDISFNVREGEIFGFIGPNGAGKTTLLKIIATLIQPTSGSVMVNGYDCLWDEDSVRMQIGLASAEERSFYWRLTVTQNLMFFARLYGMSDRSALLRIAELLARFGLEEYGHRRFGELSTGNKQRLAVARALLGDPSVLLLDEPTRSLDPLAAASMRSLISELVIEHPHISILLTSHNLSEVEELCSRVAIISRGEIRAIDSPQKLRDENMQTERVQLVVKGMTSLHAERILSHGFDDLKVTEWGENLRISFTRSSYDDRLEAAFSLLRVNAASILACHAERATLLDVMKSYEHEHMMPEPESGRC